MKRKNSLVKNHSFWMNVDKQSHNGFFEEHVQLIEMDVNQTEVHHYEAGRMSYVDVLDSIVIPCIGILIVILNTIVIYYIVKYRKSQHNPIAIVYMLNMAIGDFFVGIVMIVMKAIDIIIENKSGVMTYDHSSYLLIRDSVIRLSLFVSVLNLIPLTIDRVWAVKYPISHRQSKKTFAVKICLAIWAIAIVFVTVFYCIVYYNRVSHYGLNKMIFPLATYPTTLIFIACYIVIFRELRNSRRYRERSGSRSVSMMSVTNQLSIESRSSSVISLGKFDEKKNEVNYIRTKLATA